MSGGQMKLSSPAAPWHTMCGILQTTAVSGARPERMLVEAFLEWDR